MNIREMQPELLAHFEKLVKSDRLSHAYLFLGGFGGNEMAHWLAQALFCKEAEKPCGVCRVCQLVLSCEFSDLHVIEPDGQTIKVEQIRGLLEEVASTGFESSRKVVVIREAEKMGLNAANALLKTIEEPDSEIYIFLLTSNENLLLPTIRSRVQKIVFTKNRELLLKSLQAQGVAADEARILAEITDSVEEALELAQSDWFSPSVQALTSWAKKARMQPDDAFLELSNLTAALETKSQQEIAFELLLVLFNESGQAQLAERTFKAESMWRANVRFLACLESILL